MTPAGMTVGLPLQILTGQLLAHHPWTLSGGGIVALQAAISSAGNSHLNDYVTRIGFFADSHADEAYFLDRHFINLIAAPESHARIAVRGDEFETGSDGPRKGVVSI